MVCGGGGQCENLLAEEGLWSWTARLRCGNSAKGTECVREPRILKREQGVAEKKQKRDKRDARNKPDIFQTFVSHKVYEYLEEGNFSVSFLCHFPKPPFTPTL